MENSTEASDNGVQQKSKHLHHTIGEVKPRFHFKRSDPWSKDKSIKYFQGSWNKVIWPVIKLILFIILIVFCMVSLELSFM